MLALTRAHLTMRYHQMEKKRKAKRYTAETASAMVVVFWLMAVMKKSVGRNTYRRGGSRRV